MTLELLAEGLPQRKVPEECGVGGWEVVYVCGQVDEGEMADIVGESAGGDGVL